MPTDVANRWDAINAAFSKQSSHFDADDMANPILQQWRTRIYQHVDQFLRPNSKMLELNAGTGIDAVRFAGKGHTIHATDISNGMIAKLREKASVSSGKITVQQVSFDQLDQVSGKFDYVFSNFGGLNCIEDLAPVTKQLPKLLKDGAFITWVIMPRVSPWEWTWLLKGKFGEAFRRIKKQGASAHLEGEYFKTYYHSVAQIERSFNSQFRLLKSEGLGFFAPPPASQNFASRFPGISRFLDQTDHALSKKFPFHHWGDHVIVTFLFNAGNSSNN